MTGAHVCWQDVNECSLGTDTCDDTFGICINTPGSFACTCQLGRLRVRSTNQCIGKSLLTDTQALGASLRLNIVIGHSYCTLSCD